MNSTQIDPFKVLGLSYDASWSDIKRAYKSLCILTHPDKRNGDSTYFILVHDAYSILKKQHKDTKYQKAPSTKQQYTNTNMEIEPQKMKDFTPSKFNNFFNNHKIDALDDVYKSGGYQNVMATRLNYQEGLDVIKSSKVHIPTQQVVLYKEPESLPVSSALDSCYHFGQTNITDYSGGGGTDIMKAYCHVDGEPIDTCRRYKNIDELQSSRSTQSFALSKEDRKKQKEMAKLQAKLEQVRLQNVHHSDNHVANSYVQLNRRIAQ